MVQEPHAQQSAPVGAVVGPIEGEAARGEGAEGRRRMTLARLQPATLLILTPLTIPLLSRRGEDDHDGEPRAEAPKEGSIASAVSSRREQPRTGEEARAGLQNRGPTASTVTSRREEPRTGTQGGGEGE